MMNDYVKTIRKLTIINNNLERKIIDLEYRLEKQQVLLQYWRNQSQQSFDNRIKLIGVKNKRSNR